MSDESAAKIQEARHDWVAEHRNAYIESGGVHGHIADLIPVGGYSFGTHLLLKYKGRKSGKTFITPLCYTVSAGEVAIIASKGGADHHPTWYLNLVEQDELAFQIASQAFRATWREPEGAEREKVWNMMADCFPFYNEYRKATSRVLPLVTLKPIEEIPLFKLEELG